MKEARNLKILDRHKLTVSNLLQIYDGKTPFHLYLKKYFSENKKHGSKDRAMITDLCYSYFRLGKNGPNLQKENPPVSLSAILDLAGYISGTLAPPDILDDYADAIPTTPILRFNLAKNYYNSLDQTALFPFKSPTSDGLTLASFQASILVQPSLFIRIRPGLKAKVLKTLAENDVYYQHFTEYGDDIVAFSNNKQVSKWFAINKEVVIQDINSQRMAIFFNTIIERQLQKDANVTNGKLKIWDCCAASGGKSILAWDIFNSADLKIKLTVTDIRQTILNNLDKRFKEAAIQGYKKQVLDLSSRSPLPFTNGFDLVICDAPCTGSGTWARHPENILFFDELSINDYYNKQTSIAQKAWQSVLPGGYFLYITCSVFKRENEDVVDFILENSGMELLQSRLLVGYDIGGDTMYGALFTRTK